MNRSVETRPKFSAKLFADAATDVSADVVAALASKFLVALFSFTTLSLTLSTPALAETESESTSNESSETSADPNFADSSRDPASEKNKRGVNAKPATSAQSTAAQNSSTAESSNLESPAQESKLIERAKNKRGLWRVTALGGPGFSNFGHFGDQWKTQAISSPLMRLNAAYVFDVSGESLGFVVGVDGIYKRSVTEISGASSARLEMNYLGAGASIGGAYRPAMWSGFGIAADIGILREIYNSSELQSKGFTTDIKSGPMSVLLVGLYATYRLNPKFELVLGYSSIEGSNHLVGGGSYAF